MEQESVLIGMSGGVDSSVAAYLLNKEGYGCIGATMRLASSLTEESGRCSEEDVEDAKAVAYRLGMSFHVFNFTDAFRQCVVDPFVRCYESGLTPNPCIECNKHLKFSKFLEHASLLGCNYVATGHYAQIRRDQDTGRYLLFKATDTAKDQTYFLYTLTQQQLAHTLLPLGSLTKDEVRQIAQEQGFINARKRDSQDICFIPDGDYRAFLERYTSKTYPAGQYLDLSGKVVGIHKGAVSYTLGQRKGLGIAMGEPVYVCGKDMEANTVTVGPNDALFKTTLLAQDWNWIAFPAPAEPIRAFAKARSRMTEQPATVYPEADGTYRIVFDQPQRALTPGQAVVLYAGDLVIGGGTIQRVCD